MMSRERELLKKIITGDDEGKWIISHILYNNIKELLAQPEHKEEPVAWMYERQKGDFTERTLSVGFEKNFDGTTIPLYTSPPKREPLSKEQYMKFFTDTYDSVKPITDFVRLVEKAHGIGVDDE